jgi:hypothetical protein
MLDRGHHLTGQKMQMGLSGGALQVYFAERQEWRGLTGFPQE